MLKKALIGTAVMASLAAFVFGRDAFSYVKTWGSTVREAVRAEVPLEFEIERARKMVEELVPDIRRCMHVIAEQQVDIEYLNEQIARRESNLESERRTILAMKEDLEQGGTQFVYAGRSYTEREVRADLAERFARYKSAQEALDRDRRMLEARKKALAANQDKLETMLAAREELEVQLAELESRLKTLEAAEAVSELAIDDSRLARARSLIHELNRQLDVKERLLDSEGRFAGLIPVGPEAPAAEEIAREIDEYFELTPPSERLVDGR